MYLRLSAGNRCRVWSPTAGSSSARLGISGELGHVTVAPDGAICRCGNRGCLETVASPAAIVSLLSTGLGADVTVAELFEMLAQGHRGAVRAVADAGFAAGQALAEAVMILNPALIVVGGELADAGEVAASSRCAARSHVTPCGCTPLRFIVAGVLGDSAGVRGAAALVLSDAPRRLAARA